MKESTRRWIAALEKHMRFCIDPKVPSHAAMIREIEAPEVKPTGPYWCSIHQHYKACEHNGGVACASGYEFPAGHPARLDWCLGCSAMLVPGNVRYCDDCAPVAEVKPTGRFRLEGKGLIDTEGGLDLCTSCGKLPPHEGCKAICAACAPPTGACYCAGCTVAGKGAPAPEVKPTGPLCPGCAHEGPRAHDPSSGCPRAEVKPTGEGRRHPVHAYHDADYPGGAPAPSPQEGAPRPCPECGETDALCACGAVTLAPRPTEPVPTPRSHLPYPTGARCLCGDTVAAPNTNGIWVWPKGHAGYFTSDTCREPVSAPAATKAP